MIQVGPQRLLEALRLLTAKAGVRHLSTITGLDLGDGIGVDYQFAESNRIIAIRTILPKTSLSMETSAGIVPGAILYEMEIHDMFGVVFSGNPWIDRKLLLPENYPADMPPPLLKSTSSEKIRKAVGVEK